MVSRDLSGIDPYGAYAERIDAFVWTIYRGKRYKDLGLGAAWILGGGG